MTGRDERLERCHLQQHRFQGALPPLVQCAAVGNLLEELRGSEVRRKPELVRNAFFERSLELEHDQRIRCRGRCEHRRAARRAPVRQRGDRARERRDLALVDPRRDRRRPEANPERHQRRGHHADQAAEPPLKQAAKLARGAFDSFVELIGQIADSTVVDARLAEVVGEHQKASARHLRPACRLRPRARDNESDPSRRLGCPDNGAFG